jgi:hypothetical protein
MATSKSSKELRRWIGGASVFSGRPDPTWEVDDAVAQELVNLWNLSKSYTGQRPSAPRLGYRGCFLRCATDREWTAYGGVVTLTTGGSCESRTDKGRKFEKMLLASAPEGLFPAPLIEND